MSVAAFCSGSHEYDAARVRNDGMGLTGFDLERGSEILVLVGPIGNGNTTALNLLAGCLKATSGRCFGSTSPPELLLYTRGGAAWM